MNVNTQLTSSALRHASPNERPAVSALEASRSATIDGRPNGSLNAASRTTLDAPATIGPNTPTALPAKTIDAIANTALAQVADPMEDPDAFIKGLEGAWGTSDPTYDLDGSGTVDVMDLMKYLAGDQTGGANDAGANDAPSAGQDVFEAIKQAASPSTGAADPDAGAAPPLGEPGGPSMVDRILDGWGSADANLDLDQSGTVDVSDLLGALAGEAAGAAGGSTPGTPDVSGAAAAGPGPDVSHAAATGPAVTPDVSGAAAAEGAATDPLGAPADSTIDQLLRAWGGEGSEVQGADGETFDVADLLAKLAKRAAEAHRDDDPSTSNQIGGGQNEAARAANDATRLADSVAESLKAAGFENAPPSNLASLVDRLGPNLQDTQTFLARLSQNFPGGFGVNAKA